MRDERHDGERHDGERHDGERHDGERHDGATQTAVVDEVAASRFEILVDGQVVGFADYRIRGSAVELPHTVIDPSMRGRGLAAILVEEALRSIAASGRTVIASCWYVAQYLDEHPEHAALRAG